MVKFQWNDAQYPVNKPLKQLIQSIQEVCVVSSCIPLASGVLFHWWCATNITSWSLPVRFGVPFVRLSVSVGRGGGGAPWRSITHVLWGALEGDLLIVYCMPVACCANYGANPANQLGDWKECSPRMIPPLCDCNSNSALNCALARQVDTEILDYHYYLPMFSFGLRGEGGFGRGGLARV